MSRAAKASRSAGPRSSCSISRTLKELKRIPYDSGFAPDGIFFDSYNDHLYVCSHPTKNCAVIDSHDGNVLGYPDVKGPPEEGAADGCGTVYIVRQDGGADAVTDAKTMQNTANYSLGGKMRCNGLALDDKNEILFAACASAVGAPAPMPGMNMGRPTRSCARLAHRTPRRESRAASRRRRRRHAPRYRSWSCETPSARPSRAPSMWWCIR